MAVSVENSPNDADGVQSESDPEVTKPGSLQSGYIRLFTGTYQQPRHTTTHCPFMLAEAAAYTTYSPTASLLSSEHKRRRAVGFQSTGSEQACASDPGAEPRRVRQAG
jgi:hypothetical protein